MYGPRNNMLVWGSWPPKNKRPEAPEPAVPETKEELTADSYTGDPRDEEQAEAYEYTGDAEQAVTATEEAADISAPPEKDDRVFPFTGPSHSHPAPSPGPVYPEMELATAYIPYQRYGPTYKPAEALEKGTLFPDLYRPYPY